MACAAQIVKKSPSLNLRRYGQMQLGVQVISGIVWAMLCAAAGITTDYVMSPEIYGEAVTSVKAEVWTYPLLIACLTYIFGIFINGNWRWSPFLRLMGSGVQFVLLSLFGVMSFNRDSIDPFTVACFALSAFLLWCIFLNAGDAKRAVFRVGWNDASRH